MFTAISERSSAPHIAGQAERSKAGDHGYVAKEPVEEDRQPPKAKSKEPGIEKIRKVAKLPLVYGSMPQKRETGYVAPKRTDGFNICYGCNSADFKINDEIIKCIGNCQRNWHRSCVDPWIERKEANFWCEMYDCDIIRLDGSHMARPGRTTKGIRKWPADRAPRNRRLRRDSNPGSDSNSGWPHIWDEAKGRYRDLDSEEWDRFCEQGTPRHPGRNVLDGVYSIIPVQTWRDAGAVTHPWIAAALQKDHGKDDSSEIKTSNGAKNPTTASKGPKSAARGHEKKRTDTVGTDDEESDDDHYLTMRETAEKTPVLKAPAARTRVTKTPALTSRRTGVHHSGGDGVEDPPMGAEDNDDSDENDAIPPSRYKGKKAIRRMDYDNTDDESAAHPDRGPGQGRKRSAEYDEDDVEDDETPTRMAPTKRRKTMGPDVVSTPNIRN